MLAAVMYGVDNIRIEDVEKPKINDNEILLKVKSVGICGTDLRIIKNGRDDIHENNPRILGHEISGIIVEVGKNVKSYKVGMRVAVAPNTGCGVCDFCARGDYHLCHDYYALGVHLNGGFAEYVKIPENFVRLGNVVELPEHVSFDEGAIIEPLSCVYNGLSATPVKPGDNVCIIGAGTIGVMFALLAKLSGASKVIVANRTPDRLKLCKSIDPSLITVESTNLENEVNNQTNGNGADVCIVACSSPSAQAQALELTGMNGSVNYFGGLPKNNEMVKINTNAIHYKQLKVTGTTKANNYYFRESLKLINDKKLNIKKLITNKYSINDFNEATKSANISKGLKSIITFD